jgi:hypothetical protein
MAILFAGLLLCAGCAGMSSNNPQRDPTGIMYDERTGTPVEPLDP